MRALILADELFASRERSLLGRLEVGLADEGWRVVHAAPENVPLDLGGAPVFAKVVRYRPARSRLMLALTVRRLLRALRDIAQAEEPGSEGIERPVDVVHVFGGSAWAIGDALSREIGCGLALEVWRAGLVQPAGAFPHASSRPVALLAPDPAIERGLAPVVPAGGPRVQLTPWGVHAADAPRPVFEPGRTVAAMVVGAGRDEKAFLAALEGLASLAKTLGDLEVFCDALAARRAHVWEESRRLGLLPHLSLIDELEARRDLLLQGDMLIVPEPAGEQRSVVLEAMAGGLVVLAARDPYLSPLEDQVTALQLPAGDARAWKAALVGLAQSPESARALGQNAHRFVREKRRASEHVRTVLSAYAWLSPQASPR